MTVASKADELYEKGEAGIWSPRVPVAHRSDEYDPEWFDILDRMQARHFWYLGRQRFLLHALRRHLPRTSGEPGRRSMIDLGGGVGGWVAFLERRLPGAFAEAALSDSSVKALQRAGGILPERVRRYQIDLLNLGWNDRWDVAFLLDVLEHIPDDVLAMREVARAIRPGGLLFVTTPALQSFWSYNDELVGHQRRYNRDDFQRLAKESGLQLCDSRYFMFFLSPLYLLARRKKVPVKSMSHEEMRDLLAATHRVPAAPVNTALRGVFSAETPLGHWLRFPWGTSILGVFQKPRGS